MCFEIRASVNYRRLLFLCALRNYSFPAKNVFNIVENVRIKCTLANRPARDSVSFNYQKVKGIDFPDFAETLITVLWV